MENVRIFNFVEGKIERRAFKEEGEERRKGREAFYCIRLAPSNLFKVNILNTQVLCYSSSIVVVLLFNSPTPTTTVPMSLRFLSVSIMFTRILGF